MTKHETVCITRGGFNFLHSEGIDLAAKVTHQSYVPSVNGSGGAHVAVLNELFVPRFPPDWETI